MIMKPACLIRGVITLHFDICQQQIRSYRPPHNICTLNSKPHEFLNCHLKVVTEIHVLIFNIFSACSYSHYIFWE